MRIPHISILKAPTIKLNNMKKRDIRIKLKPDFESFAGKEWESVKEILKSADPDRFPAIAANFSINAFSF